MPCLYRFSSVSIWELLANSVLKDKDEVVVVFKTKLGQSIKKGIPAYFLRQVPKKNDLVTKGLQIDTRRMDTALSRLSLWRRALVCVCVDLSCIDLKALSHTPVWILCLSDNGAKP